MIPGMGSFNEPTFSFGVYHERNTVYYGGSENPMCAQTTPNLVKIILPLGKGFVLGWGLSPYSKTDGVVEVSNDNYIDQMKSSGGINISALGLATSYKDIIYLGISYNYNFGMIREEWSRTFPNDDSLNETYDVIKKKYKGYNTTIGILARITANTSIGAGYTDKVDLDNTVKISSGDISVSTMD